MGWSGRLSNKLSVVVPSQFDSCDDTCSFILHSSLPYGVHKIHNIADADITFPNGIIKLDFYRIFFYVGVMLAKEIEMVKSAICRVRGVFCHSKHNVNNDILCAGISLY